MDIKTFADKLAKEIMSERTDLKVDVQEVVKTNGVTLHGLIVRNEGDCVAPTIYADGYFKAYEGGKMSFPDIIKEVIDQYEESRPEETDFFETFKDWEKAREKVVFRLLNKAANEKLLKRSPHREVCGDLVLVYTLVIRIDGNLGETVISNEIAESWGATEEDIYTAAMESAPKVLPADVKLIGDVIEAMLPGSNPNAPGDLIVVSNKEASYGAGTILYPGVLESIAKEHGSDLFIIPSSIHECLIFPVKRCDEAKEFTQMVREVNASCVTADEVLSDHVYRYNKETGAITGGEQ